MSLDESTDVSEGISCATKPCKFTFFCGSIYGCTKTSELQAPNKLPVEAGSWGL